MASVFTKCTCFTSGQDTNDVINLLTCAPCPPRTFDYNAFVSFAEKQNLSTCEIGRIASKCGLEAVTSLDNLTELSTDNVTESTILLGKSSLEPDQLDAWAIAMLAVFGTGVLLAAAVYLLIVLRHRFTDNGNTERKSNGQIKTEKFDVQYSTQKERGILNAAFSRLESLTRGEGVDSVVKSGQSSSDNKDDTRETIGESNNVTQCSDFNKSRLVADEHENDIQVK